MWNRLKKEQPRSVSVLIVFGVLAASLSTVVFPFAEKSLEWVGFDSFIYRGEDKGYEKAPPGSGEYSNPILAGFYPDPSICRVGKDYYLVNSTFAYFPGIPVFHSRDLVNRDQAGHGIHRPEQLRYGGLGVSRGIFAPAINYHDGIFYVVCTMVDGRERTPIGGPLQKRVHERRPGPLQSRDRLLSAPHRPEPDIEGGAFEYVTTGR
ncbi:MAG: family 43 glycosylhydrolase [Acidobacteria bacterium]|nr:family 43 glycosylhydrolase [Acidobacteriota bacterium]